MSISECFTVFLISSDETVLSLQGKPRSAPHRRPESTFFKSSPTGRDGKKHTRSGVHVVLPGGSQSDDDEQLK